MEYLTIKCSDPLSIDIENEYGHTIHIGTRTPSGYSIHVNDILDLSFVEDHIEDQIKEETEELNDEISRLFELLNAKDELFDAFVESVHKNMNDPEALRKITQYYLTKKQDE